MTLAERELIAIEKVEANGGKTWGFEGYKKQLKERIKKENKRDDLHTRKISG